MSKPLIGVTCPCRGGTLSWILIKFLIWSQGGRSVRITPSRHFPAERLSGLVLGGGADIDPTLYHESMMQILKKETGNVKHWNLKYLMSVVVWVFRKIFSVEFTTVREDKARDRLEFEILKQATQRSIPILGICRGAQMINVYFGGSLHQDIASFYVEKPDLRTILPRSTVAIDPRSKLHSIFKKRWVKVNSLHNQAVKEIGNGLKVVAQELNGVIEAIEHVDFKFMIGVQWHPEFLFFDKKQSLLFKALVNEASDHI